MTAKTFVLALLVFSLGTALAACSTKPKATSPTRPPPGWKVSLLEDTVGAIADLEGHHPISVRGYGVLVGLTSGAGSRECPAHILEIIRKQFQGRANPDGTPINVDPQTLINKLSTAVVIVDGQIPAAATRGDLIDLSIAALPNTQTTSLAGGALSITDLSIEVVSRAGRPIRKRPMVLAGYPEPVPIFVDPFARDDSAKNPARLRSGRIIGGGRVLHDRSLALILRIPGGSTRLVRQITERINFRFPAYPGDPDTAIADNVTAVKLNIPREYRSRQRHFLMLVLQTYLADDPVYINRRAEQLIAELANPNSQADQIAAALESIGKSTLPALARAYNSTDPRVAFYAASTAALLDDNRAVALLGKIAADNASPYQLPATAALAELPGYRANQALRPLLDSSNTLVRIRAYEGLAKNNDPSVIPISFERPAEFELHVVRTSAEPLVYVQTSKQPRIVLFGRIRCREPLFYMSPDKLLTINYTPTPDKQPQPDQKETQQLFVLRCTPSGAIGARLRTSPDLISLIRTLGSDIEPDHKGVHYGLGMDYSQVVATLHGLWRNKDIQAGFVLQASPGARALVESPASASERPEK